MPAHLVIVKGTEYFDGKQGKYVDFPVTGRLVFLSNFFLLRRPPNDGSRRSTAVRRFGSGGDFCAGREEELLQEVSLRAVSCRIEVSGGLFRLVKERGG
jgi:hypothetical protein